MGGRLGRQRREVWRVVRGGVWRVMKLERGGGGVSGWGERGEGREGGGRGEGGKNLWMRDWIVEISRVEVEDGEAVEVEEAEVIVLATSWKKAILSTNYSE